MLISLLALMGLSGVAQADFIASLQSVNSGKCIDVSGSSQANNAAIIQYTCHGGNNQKMRFEQFPGSDTYILRFQHSQMCVEIPNNNSNNGTDIRQAQCHANKNQRWRLADIGAGQYTLTLVQSGKVLEVAGGSSANLAKIQQWQYSNVAQQRWTLQNRQEIAENRAISGEWSEVIEWPHIPVSAASLPDGRVITWSSNERTSFPVQDQMTYSSVFNPDNYSFVDMNNSRHDMFCAGISMLPDGSVLASGGNPTLQHSSIFNLDEGRWSAAPFMNQTRWYGTSLSLPSGEVMATFAKQANEIPEIYTPGSGWTELPDAHMQGLLNDQNSVNAAAINNATTAQWYAYMHVAPDGRVFHPGPTKTMHWFDTTGSGSVVSAGLRNGETRHRQFGSSTMYDVGKLLVTGGADRSKTPASTATAMTIDINGSSPVVNQIDDMIAGRTNHNAVVLPTGEVLVMGGNSTGILFDDADSVMPAEAWNPDSGQWRTLDRINIPRNYHSLGILLQDARVLTAGGGLCGGCTANHQDGQIFSPPYLFNADGSEANRPQINQAPESTLAAASIEVQTNSAVYDFNMIRLSGVTHSINTDQRFLPVDFETLGNNRYQLHMYENPNVLIPGNYWLFALNASGVPSTGKLINVGVGVANIAPTVGNPGTQNGIVGDQVNLLISATDDDGDSLVFDASGLPVGLSINSVNGRISGTLQSSGTSTVLVTVSDGSNNSVVSFNWVIEDQVSTNHPPVISNPTNQSGTVGDSVSLNLTATDIDGDTLLFSAENLPSGLQINSQSGRITGTLSQQQQTQTTVSVSDGELSASQSFAWSVQASNTGGWTLTHGQSQSNDLALQEWHFYEIEADAEFDTLIVELTGLDADIDLYVRANQRPSDHVENGGIYDCDSTNGGVSEEVCRLDNTTTTTWHIGLYGYRASSYTLTARLETNGSGNGDDRPLASGQAVDDNLSLKEWRFYTIDSSASDEQLTVNLTNLSADIDLYVRAGSRPSGATDQGGVYDCESIYGGTSSEQCQLDINGEERWYIGLYGYRASNYRLMATFESEGGGGDDITPLVPGSQINSNLSLREWKYYSVDVPANKSRLEVQLSGLSADIDLYVRQNQKPSGTVAEGGQYDCGSYAGGTSTEQCELNDAQGKQYIIGIYGYRASTYNLKATTDNGVIDIPELGNGDSTNGTVQASEWQYYRINVPASLSRLSVELTNQTADGDLFVRKGQMPNGDVYTGANADCYSVLGGRSSELCVVENTGSNQWFVGVYGYQTSNYTLTVNANNNQRLVVNKLVRLGKGQSIKTETTPQPSEDTSSSGASGGTLGYLWLFGLTGLLLVRRKM